MDYIDQDMLRFQLFDWLDVAQMTQRPAYNDHDTATLTAVLDLSAQLAKDTFAKNFKLSDQEEPKLVDGKAIVPPQTHEDLAAFREAGFFGMSFAPEFGGMGLPKPITMATMANFTAANPSTAAYPFLTFANVNLLLKFGTQAQIETWATPQIEGRFYGTMCLSEPHAGSSLGDIRTRADHIAQDALGAKYRLRGNKMWISGGAQEISENIVNLVLAKIPDEDGNLIPGVPGISLFAVPKYLPDGAMNDIALAGLNHKMGYRGTTNCLLNFGEKEGAIGWRIGEVGQGLAIMFTMMNEARVGVGMGAAALGVRGYVQSLDYAKTRTQGRLPDQRDASSAMVPIIEHTDVKRMLIQQKAYAEGAMALCLYCAKLSDDIETHPDEAQRVSAQQLLDLLTPITKSWPAEFCLAANDLAIQVHGGYGYTRDYDVEQIYRDNRLNPIHEGTFGIQAADLAGRKLWQNGGAGYKTLLGLMQKTVAKAKSDDRHRQSASQLEKAISSLEMAVVSMQKVENRSAVLDNAAAFLSAFGHVVVGWLWLSQRLAATETASREDSVMAASGYFMTLELPKAILALSQVAQGRSTFSDLDLSVF